MELEPAAAFPVFEIPSENELEKCGWQLVVLSFSFVGFNRNGHLLESCIISQRNQLKVACAKLINRASN